MQAVTVGKLESENHPSVPVVLDDLVVRADGEQVSIAPEPVKVQLTTGVLEFGLMNWMLRHDPASKTRVMDSILRIALDTESVLKYMNIRVSPSLRTQRFPIRR